MLIELLSLRFPEIERDALLASIFCGEVFVNRERIRDPKRKVETDAIVDIKPKDLLKAGCRRGKCFRCGTITH